MLSTARQGRPAHPQLMLVAAHLVSATDDGQQMRSDPDPQAMLAACLGIPLAEFRQAAPYAWRQVPICVNGVPPGWEPGIETGVWFTAGDPVVAIIGVLPHSIVVCPPDRYRRSADQISYDVSGMGSHVRLPRNDPDLHRVLPRVIATIAKRRYPISAM